MLQRSAAQRLRTKIKAILGSKIRFGLKYGLRHYSCALKARLFALRDVTPRTVAFLGQIVRCASLFVKWASLDAASGHSGALRLSDPAEIF